LIIELVAHYSCSTSYRPQIIFSFSQVLTYVAEITQPHLRGALTATSTMSIIFGVFTQFLFGSLMYWRTVALVNTIFTVRNKVILIRSRNRKQCRIRRISNKEMCLIPLIVWMESLYRHLVSLNAR
jgi:hypothetical protein